MERRKQREEKREREGREGRKERERERGGRSNLKHIAHSDAERLVRDLCVVLAGDLLKRFLHPDAGSVAGIALRAHTLTTQAAQPEKITKVEKQSVPASHLLPHASTPSLPESPARTPARCGTGCHPSRTASVTRPQRA